MFEVSFMLQTQWITRWTFQVSFVLIGKLTMTFLTGQSRHILKSWYIDGAPEQRFWCCFADIRWTFKSKTKTIRVKFTCGAGYYTGHQSTAGQVPVMLFGRTCFCPDTTCFWPVKCNSQNFCNNEPKLHSKPFFKQKTNWILVSLTTKLQIKSFTSHHSRSSLTYVERLWFEAICSHHMWQITFWQSPHRTFLRVKHAKYNENRTVQSIS